MKISNPEPQGSQKSKVLISRGPEGLARLRQRIIELRAG
jgi:hypothetical protein